MRRAFAPDHRSGGCRNVVRRHGLGRHVSAHTTVQLTTAVELHAFRRPLRAAARAIGAIADIRQSPELKVNCPRWGGCEGLPVTFVKKERLDVSIAEAPKPPLADL